MRLLPSMILSASLALGGVVLLKLYGRPQPPMKPPCPATVSLTVAGATREAPFEVFMADRCEYGTDWRVRDDRTMSQLCSRCYSHWRSAGWQG
jgi:hypothetical protein